MMTNRRTKFFAFAAAALISLLASTSAQAQWWPGRDRDRDDNDRYGRRYGHISDHERRMLRDLARRINDRSRSFQRNIDRALDRSRIDDTRREDRINQEVADFRRAAERFRDRAGESNDLSRSRSEAQQLLSDGARIDRLVGRVRIDSRAANDWAQIRSDLFTVADIYNIRTGGFGNGRRNDDYYGRDRDRDRDRGRDRDRDRDRRDGGVFPWPRNWPF